MIFPKVKKAKYGVKSINFSSKPVYEFYGANTDEAKKWCDTFECEYAEKGNVRVVMHKVFERDMLQNENGTFTDEKYMLEITYRDIPEILISYCFENALWHALNTLKKIVDSGTTDYCFIIDEPAFVKRGFIEGFYGKPWDDEERFSVMKLMSSCHMNTYYYAPKYDVYHREKWQEKYDDKALKKLSELVKKSEQLHLEFNWCIAPGLTVQYSGQEQFYVLMDKIKQVYDIGVRHFGILLDDISPVLQYENDRIAYDSLEVAHICYINNIYKALKEIDKKNTLTFCPSQYHGTGNENYIARVGSGIKKGIDIFWTGRNICSQELTCRQAVTFFENTHHAPLYWDNFPVNDAEMVNEMHLCPLIGRDSELDRCSRGLIANCMAYAETSKIPLMTIADYLWNSEAYSPDESFENACEEVNGKGTYRYISYFTDNLRYSCLKDDNSVLMNKCLYSVQFNIRSGKNEQATADLKSYTEKFNRSVQHLSEKLQKELSFWINKHSLCAELLGACIAFLENNNEENRLLLRQKSESYNMHPARHADFCLQEFVDFLLI